MLDLYVSLGGDDSNAGTSLDAPFQTLEQARATIRALPSLPDGGVTVWIRGGFYERTTTFQLTSADSGEEGKPIVWRAYNNEDVRIVGGKRIDPLAFATTTGASPLWGQIDPTAQGHIVELDLATMGVTDLGTLKYRGYFVKGNAALEFFVDQEPKQLARWPKQTDQNTFSDWNSASITVFGNLTPDVTGTYLPDGTSDGVTRFKRDGLVEGEQYYYYRHRFELWGEEVVAQYLVNQESGSPVLGTYFWVSFNYEDFGVISLEPGQTSLGIGIASVRDPDKINVGLMAVERGLAANQFSYVNNRPSRWALAEEIWLHGWWGKDWVGWHTKVDVLDTVGKTFTMVQSPTYGFRDFQYFYASNLIEELTLEGEWYLQRSTGILYHWPEANFTRKELVVSMLEADVVLLNGADYVYLQGLTIEMGRTDSLAVNGDHNKVLDCRFRNTGNHGIDCNGIDLEIGRCTFVDIGDTAIQMNGGDRASLTQSENEIHNCTFDRFGRWRHITGYAVELFDCGHTVRNCEFADGYHTAIRFTGNEHLIKECKFTRISEWASDTGVIYAGPGWGFRGNVIRDCYFYDVHPKIRSWGTFGVYLDNCMSGVLVEKCIFYDLDYNAIQHNGGRDVIMRNNIISNVGRWGVYSASAGVQRINCTPGSLDNYLERLGDDGVLYQEEPWASAYPEVARIPNSCPTTIDLSKKWAYPENSELVKNVLHACASDTHYRQNWIQLDAQFSVTDCFRAIAENVTGDPKFVNAPVDMNVLPGSSVEQISDWEPILFDNIGLE